MFPGDAQSLEAALLEKCCQTERRQSRAAVLPLCPSLSQEGWRGGWKGTGHVLPLTPPLTQLVPALSPGQ